MEKGRKERERESEEDAVLRNPKEKKRIFVLCMLYVFVCMQIAFEEYKFVSRPLNQVNSSNGLISLNT